MILICSLFISYFFSLSENYVKHNGSCEGASLFLQMVKSKEILFTLPCFVIVLKTPLK